MEKELIMNYKNDQIMQLQIDAEIYYGVEFGDHQGTYSVMIRMAD